MKKISYIFSINLAILLSLLLLIETVSRIVLPYENLNPIFNDENLRIRGRSFVEPSSTKGFVLKPGFSNGFYTINSKGFRGEQFTWPLAKKKVILTLGESTTFGWGVKDNETYPAFLMDYFNEKDQVYVVNGGVPSYTSSQVLLGLQEILIQEKLNLDLVLINILWNDIWYSSISNWHPDILIFQKPPVWLEFLIKNSRFCHGFIMGGGKKNDKTDIFNEKALLLYEKNIEKMILQCKKKNISLAFVEPPFDGDHMPKAGLNEFHVRYSKEFFIKTAQKYIKTLHIVADKYKISVIAHDLDIRNLHQKELFLDALHPTAQGNSIIAQDIYNSINIKNNVFEVKKSYR